MRANTIFFGRTPFNIWGPRIIIYDPAYSLFMVINIVKHIPWVLNLMRIDIKLFLLPT